MNLSPPIRELGRRLTFGVPVLSQEVRESAAELVRELRGDACAAALLAPTYDVVHVTDRGRAVYLAAKFTNEEQVCTGFDFETDGWNPLGMQRPSITGEDEYTRSVSVLQPDVPLVPVTFQLWRGPPDPVYVVDAQHLPIFMPWLHDQALLDGAHFGMEAGVVCRLGFDLPRMERDSVHCDYLIAETTRQGMHDLKGCVRDRLGLNPREYSATVGKKRKFSDALRDNYEHAVDYAAFDAWDVRFLCDVLQVLLSLEPSRPGYDSLWDFYTHCERSLTQCVIHIDEAGFPIVEEVVRVHHQRLVDAIAQLEAQAYKTIGRPINLSSDKQLRQYFYTERGFPVQTTTDGWMCLICDKGVDSKTKNRCKIHGRGALVNKPKVDEVAIAVFEAAGDPLAPILSKRNKLDKQRTDNVKKLFAMSSPAAGSGRYPWENDVPGLRVLHPGLNASNVVSGRFSSPLLYMLPKAFKDVTGFPGPIADEVDYTAVNAPVSDDVETLLIDEEVAG